ncbi:MAG: enoyl-CoA hydratase/isomerase family protein [Lachnospiraceae bacterium]|nr:enoyl-CoA hydratase/isomerase family protein [Lachnospiraceae bacterium]
MSDFLMERHGKTALFILNRPEKYNTFSIDMMFQMHDALNEFMADPELLTGIITGAGKGFCAGADVSNWLPYAKENLEKPWNIPTTPMRGMYVTKPLIAAVHGAAFGGGAELAISCDFRIAAENASFKWPEAAIGTFPRQGGTQRLPRLVGLSRALEIMITNERVAAEKALEIGLVNKVVPQEKLLEESFAFADKINKLAPLAVQAIKKSMYEGYGRPLEDGLAIESHLGKQMFFTEDYEEGTRAFREKREPQFKGR